MFQTEKMTASPDEIREIIVGALTAVLPEPVAITDSTNIVQDLGLDSLAVMNFVMGIEDDLDISVPLDRIAEVQTVGDLVKTINELMAEV
jgi:acyl carrier protein